jgi:8-oxo-dGTP pyrophosphatase MutT (NUDIX family)
MKNKKLVRRARQGKSIHQVAALPYRQTPHGELEILLLTSRQTGRFVLPKGWPMKGRKDCEAAAREAAEEAGVAGTFGKEPVGSYRYWKRLKDSFVPVRVHIYPLKVEEQLGDWKERGQRSRAWLPASQAALLVDEPELASLFDTIGSAEQVA